MFSKGNLDRKEILKQIAPVIFTLVLFVLLITGLTSNIPDPDAFYHIRHSWIYRTSGIFDSSFPWTQYSVIKDIGADLWYGFHIFILPLTYFPNLVDGIKFGGTLMMFFSLLLAYMAFRKLSLRWPLFWVFVFALGAADILYRLTMLRPHPITISLTLLLFAFFASKNHRGGFWIFLISAAYSWLHLSLSWVPILTVLTIGLFRLVYRQRVNWPQSFSLLIGLAVGWLLRPNPFGAAKLAYIQVLKLLVDKQGGLPLRFGKELLPFVWENFVDMLIPISVLMLLAIGFFIWALRKKDFLEIANEMKPVFWSSLALAVFFFALSFILARRSNEFFIGFGVIFLGLVFTHYWNLRHRIPKFYFASWLTKLIGVIIVVALIYGPLKTVYRYNTYTANAFAPERFREVAEWLQLNSNPGEIVFNLQWDRFAQVFFWNYQNYYINGMDPIFELAYSPSLYWKNHYLFIDQFFVQDGVAKVCGEIRCSVDMVEDIYMVLFRDFKASFLFLEKNRNPKLYNYLKTDSRFENVFETDFEAVFRIKP